MNLEELLSTLESPIVIRPTRRMTQGELESYLDKAADILRGNADHPEFRGYVFALLFYKRARLRRRGFFGARVCRGGVFVALARSGRMERHRPSRLARGGRCVAPGSPAVIGRGG